MIASKGQGKGRPTPSRRAAEQANRRPVVPKDRKAAKKESRRKQNRQWEIEQHAMKTGDEANYPYNHRGPVRRWGRDYVDARRNFSSLFFFFAFGIVFLLIAMRLFPEYGAYATLALYVVLIIMLVEGFIVSGKIRKKAIAKFGAERVPPGFRWQLFGRMFYPRFMRRPKAVVKAGEWPAGAK